MFISTAGSPPVEVRGQQEAIEAVQHCLALAELCASSLRRVAWTPERAYSTESLTVIVYAALRHLHAELEGWS